MSGVSKVDLDPILQELGEFGRYQTLNYVCILVPILFSAIYISQYIFAAGAIDYRCQVPECEASPPVFESNWTAWALPEGGGQCERLQPLADSCSPGSFHLNQTAPCTAWVYQHNNTIFAEFNLACQEWKRTIVGTLHSAGMFATLPITAFVSDTYGRRTAFILTAVLAGIMGVCRAFSRGYVMYLVLEFAEAALGAGVYSTGFILALEMVGLNRRVIGGNLISCTFALGQVVLGLAAWAVPYWRTLLHVIYAPSILFILYCFIIQESVRWLLSKGRKKEAAQIIFKAAAINKKKLSPATIKLLTDEDNEQIKPVTIEKEEKKQSLAIQVLKSRTLVSRLFICSFWWITLTFIYYGLSINSVSLAGNQYVNFILTSLVEIPGYCISMLTLDRFGRKTSIISAFFICGLSLISFPFVPETLQWLKVTLNMVGKLSISMAFSSIYIYTSELMPTEVRHSLLGLCSMVGRVGNLLAPQTPLLTAYWDSLPYLIFGVMAATSGLLMLLTPETLKTQLPDTVAQAENINSPNKTNRPS